MSHPPIAKTGLLLTAGLGLALLMPLPAYPQSAADYQARIQRMERDLRDLQSEMFRRNPPAARNGQPVPPIVEVAPEPPPPAMPDLNPMIRRIDEIENGITRLTGQMEELGHQIDLMNQRTERLQKDMEYQAKQAADAARAAPVLVPGDTLASAQPPADAGAPVLRGAPPAALGTLPQGATLPAPQGPPAQASAAAMRRQFDGAMNLLSRAQYEQASEAFRNFAETYPDDARAGAALYWTGDIAYSVMKNYEEGARTFAELLKRYPATARAPESMLKLGLSLFELGQTRAGCETLAALPAKYPDANAALANRARTERRERNCR